MNDARQVVAATKEIAKRSCLSWKTEMKRKSQAVPEKWYEVRRKVVPEPNDSTSDESKCSCCTMCINERNDLANEKKERLIEKGPNEFPLEEEENCSTKWNEQCHAWNWEQRKMLAVWMNKQTKMPLQLTDRITKSVLALPAPKRGRMKTYMCGWLQQYIGAKDYTHVWKIATIHTNVLEDNKRSCLCQYRKNK